MYEMPPMGPSPEEQEENERLAQWEADHKKTDKELSYILTLEDAEIKIENVRKTFDEAESIFETKGREEAKPFLNILYKELGVLNDSAVEINPLAQWNRNGYLTKEQFDELNLRRKKLSNAIGIMTASGQIRHDLNKLD